MVSSGYAGYVSSNHDTIAREANTLSPEDFYENYVIARRPVIITGFPAGDEGIRLHNLGNLRYLRETAKDSIVKIEPFNATSQTFGTNLERRTVPFPKFLDILEDESQRGQWYLTTQYEDGDDEYQSSYPKLDPVCPAPTDKLVHDFPTRPSLMGNLILQQCNLWIGNSKDGSSSGLHHDFHDNLYLLLRGRKRFVLYPPSAHPYLHLRGSIEQLWGNGLLCYAPQDDHAKLEEAPSDVIRADGLDKENALRWECQYWLQKIASLAGRPLLPSPSARWPIDEPAFRMFHDDKSNLPRDLKKALTGCRKAFSALSEVTSIDYFKDSGDSGSDATSAETYSDEDDTSPLFGGSGGDDSWSEEEDADDAEALLQDLDNITEGVGGLGQHSAHVAKPEPPSFSRITAAALHRHLGLLDEASAQPPNADGKSREKRRKMKGAKHELLPLKGCTSPLIAHLEPGEMLYLPTSWFHEVTSSSDNAADANVHIAFNYWFHPPDAHLSSSKKDTFKEPYEDNHIWSTIAQEVDNQFVQLRAALTTNARNKRSNETVHGPSADKKKPRVDVDTNQSLSQPTRRKRNRPKPAARARRLRRAKQEGAVEKN